MQRMRCFQLLLIKAFSNNNFSDIKTLSLKLITTTRHNQCQNDIQYERHFVNVDSSTKKKNQNIQFNEPHTIFIF